MVSGRAKRVFLYTAALLLGPLPVMPFAKGTREFVIAIMGYGAVLALSSAYVFQGELKLKARSLLSMKLLASSLITLLFGLALLVGAVVYLLRY